MSSLPLRRLPEKTRAALEACPLEYTLERGKRHYKIIIGGVLVGVTPVAKAGGSWTTDANLAAAIRRYVRDRSGT